jgi:pimeloyl-ACP methyl ester carboxylesterase
MVALAYRKFASSSASSGNSSNVVVVAFHGLLGRRRNWNTIATSLSSRPDSFADAGSPVLVPPTVYTVDSRNHGDSPHAPEHSLRALADDIDEFLCDVVYKEQPDARVVVAGHSMSGVAVAFNLFRRANASLLRDEWKPTVRDVTHVPIAAAAIVDAAPAPRPRSFYALADQIEKLAALPVGQGKTLAEGRKLIDGVLDPGFRNGSMVKYFASNLVIDEGLQRLRWQCNMPALCAALQDGDLLWEKSVAAALLPDAQGAFLKSDIPCHACFAKDSSYYNDVAVASFPSCFSNAVIDVVPTGGHFHHVFNPGPYTTHLVRFLRTKGLLAQR